MDLLGAKEGLLCNLEGKCAQLTHEEWEGQSRGSVAADILPFAEVAILRPPRK